MPRLQTRKKAQEFVKPIVAPRTTANSCIISYLPFDIKKRAETIPAVPKSKFTMAIA
jgi:hypothetical protein